MSKPTGKWYHHKSKNSEFYTADPLSVKKFFYVGDGNKKPTPKQALDLLNKIKQEEKNITYGPEPISEGLYYINQADSTKEVDLPSGTYQYVEGSYNSPDRLIPVTFRKDGFVKIGSVYDDILKDINSFLKKERVYRKLNIMYKRGILLYGPPGEGKTSIVREIVHNELPKDAVTMIFDKSIPPTDFLKVMKETLSDRTKLFIFEELTDFIKRDNMEDLLTFLDGEFSIDKSLIIATTNYPESLPGNIVDRPSRFDRLYKIGNPTVEQRKLILAHYLQKEPSQNDVDCTAKLSTAAIKEIVLLSHLRDISIEEAADMVKKHSELVKKNFDENKGKLGL